MAHSKPFCARTFPSSPDLQLSSQFFILTFSFFLRPQIMCHVSLSTVCFSAASFSLIGRRCTNDGTSGELSFDVFLLSTSILLPWICFIMFSLVENIWKNPMVLSFSFSCSGSGKLGFSGSTTMCFFSRDQPLSFAFRPLGFCFGLTSAFFMPPFSTTSGCSKFICCLAMSCALWKSMSLMTTPSGLVEFDKDADEFLSTLSENMQGLGSVIEVLHSVVCAAFLTMGLRCWFVAIFTVAAWLSRVFFLELLVFTASLVSGWLSDETVVLQFCSRI
uniref:Uncharacterized protein n=1 Tax=Electrophorus electricus TaxID=8005 RepID=A0A4W4EMP2_ELEEL